MSIDQNRFTFQIFKPFKLTQYEAQQIHLDPDQKLKDGVRTIVQWKLVIQIKINMCVLKSVMSNILQ